MGVRADLPGMLEWLPTQSLTVIERDSAGRPTRAGWRESYGPLPDEFVFQYHWDGDEGVSWQSIEGRILNKEDGRYMGPSQPEVGRRSSTVLTF
jgi:hypothetical protein